MQKSSARRLRSLTRIKPKKKEAEEQRPIKGFRCRICGYVYEGTVLPEDFLCPLCGHGPEDFEPVFAD